MLHDTAAKLHVYRHSISEALPGRIVASTLLLMFFSGFVFMGALQVSRTFLLEEGGYGDSYILYDALHFRQTGLIYRDLSHPPYLPAQYSPLVYMIFAAGSRIAVANPFFGPRLVALTAFVLCVTMTASLARALIPIRSAWIWGILAAGSIKSMEQWPLQLRGDFPAIFLGLTSLRLLMMRSRQMIFLAGLCAGLALDFKFTYLAPLIAGSLWLLVRKQWNDFAIFTATGVIASIGLYVLFWAREPGMVSQILALAPGVADRWGCVQLILTVLKEPVLLLALPALPLVISRSWPRWRLLLLFIIVSFFIASVTDVQAGGNINYFFEALFALTPLAVLGGFHLIAWTRHRPNPALFVTGLLMIYYLLPNFADIYARRMEISPRGVASSNGQFRTTASVLRGRHIFSTLPRMALLDPHPALVEPYLLSYLRRLGKFNAEPLLQRVRSAEFDMVLTAARPEDDSWRGIRKLEGADFDAAIAAAYQRQCSSPSMAVYLPHNRPKDESLIRQLTGIGCVPK
jgi:hypothetical protein